MDHRRRDRGGGAGTGADRGDGMTDAMTMTDVIDKTKTASMTEAVSGAASSRLSVEFGFRSPYCRLHHLDFDPAPVNRKFGCNLKDSVHGPKGQCPLGQGLNGERGREDDHEQRRP